MERSAALARLESLASQNQTSSDMRDSEVDSATAAFGPYIPEFLTLPIFALLDLPTVMRILGHPKCARPSDASLVDFASNLIKRIGLRAAALLRFADLERYSTVVRLWECLSDVPRLRQGVWRAMNIQHDMEARTPPASDERTSVRQEYAKMIETLKHQHMDKDKLENTRAESGRKQSQLKHEIEETKRGLSQLKEQAEEMKKEKSAKTDAKENEEEGKKLEKELAEQEKVLRDLKAKIEDKRKETARMDKSIRDMQADKDKKEAELKRNEKDMDSFYTKELKRIKKQTEELRQRTEEMVKERDERERLEREEQERRAKEEKERLAKEEKERLAKEEQERRAKEEKERRAKEEKERRAKEEKERRAREEREGRSQEENAPQDPLLALAALLQQNPSAQDPIWSQLKRYNERSETCLQIFESAEEGEACKDRPDFRGYKSICSQSLINIARNIESRVSPSSIEAFAQNILPEIIEQVVIRYRELPPVCRVPEVLQLFAAINAKVDEGMECYLQTIVENVVRPISEMLSTDDTEFPEFWEPLPSFLDTFTTKCERIGFNLLPEDETAISQLLERLRPVATDQGDPPQNDEAPDEQLSGTANDSDYSS